MFLAEADGEVLRLDVSVDEIVVMHVLQPLDDLVANHDEGRQGKRLLALKQKLLQILPQQLHGNDVVLSFGAVPVELRDAQASLNALQHLPLE